MTKVKFPKQPIFIDKYRVKRFVPNKIVKFLKDAGPFDLNQLYVLPNISTEEYRQFHQLIGQSVECYEELEINQEEELEEDLDIEKLIPSIVCLCGSTRFYDEFQKANYEQTMAGNIVLSVGFFPHSAEKAHGENIGCTPEQKQNLDQLHLRKIDLADRVFVINVGGYIGESTRREIEYAKSNGKPIEYLEPIERDSEEKEK